MLQLHRNDCVFPHTDYSALIALLRLHEPVCSGFLCRCDCTSTSTYYCRLLFCHYVCTLALSLSMPAIRASVETCSCPLVFMSTPQPVCSHLPLCYCLARRVCSGTNEGLLWHEQRVCSALSVAFVLLFWHSQTVLLWHELVVTPTLSLSVLLRFYICDFLTAVQ